MFTKQLIQYYKYLHGLLQELDEKCQKMNVLKESNPVEQYDVLNILKNLLGLSEDKEKENEDLDETLEGPDYSEESDEVVDDEYDKLSETYDDKDLEDDDEEDLEDDNDEQDLEDEEDDKEKKEIKMLIQDYSDDEDELNNFF
jgi:hypothetical protein